MSKTKIKNMILREDFNEKTRLIWLLVFIGILIFCSANLKAQNPANFSGKWGFDKAKSTPGTTEWNYKGTIVRQVSQNATVLSYADIYLMPGSQEWKTGDEKFNLNGKEQVEKSSTGTSKKQAKWSPDKKVLTLIYSTIYSEDGVSKESVISEAYKLSDDGKTLEVDYYSKNQVTGETKAKKVYRKK